MRKMAIILFLLLLVACGRTAEEAYENELYEIYLYEPELYELTPRPRPIQSQHPQLHDFSADAARVVAIVEEVHPIFIMPDLLPEYYDERREQFLAAAAEPMSRNAFALAILRYYTALHDGHMSMGLWDASGRSWVSGGGYLVESFIYVDGRIFLATQPAVEVIYIDNIPMQEIIDHVDYHIFFENQFARALRLPYHVGSGLFLRHAGADLTTQGGIGNPMYISLLENGQERDVLTAFSANPPAAAARTHGYIIRHEIIDDVFVIYLRSFIDGDHITAMVELIEDAIENGTSKFIVDLRGNSGGNSFAGQRLLGAMGMTLPGHGAVRRISDLAIEQRGDVFPEGETELVFMPQAYTASNPNNISLAVLTDNSSFSSSTMMATWVQDGNLGVIVGEPSSNAPSMFGDMLNYSQGLPTAANIILSLSYTRFLRPDTTADQNVLWPDVPAPAAQALEVALEFLRER